MAGRNEKKNPSNKMRQNFGKKNELFENKIFEDKIDLTCELIVALHLNAGT